ncbi:hypothetical protein QBC38DRAFT_411776 [Podospora fimiseda]|uniref:DUF1772-domain-containing protein n=1 Tax=Podospora fimiseda TaxID=252190 RepID=A0AAN7BUE4_9PEZI|nr:hypothetical protein QBC38DRAFT_411776 [Podospora fimiseda]
MPSDLRPLKASTLFLSGLTSGISLSLSAFLVPRLLQAPVPIMLQQWKSAMIQGRNSIPLLSAITALGYWYLAAKTKSTKLFGAAGGLTLGIVPYTWIWMLKTNRELVKREEEFSQVKTLTEVEEQSSKRLVDWWGVLNLGRAGMMILGFGLGLGGCFY